MPFSPRRFDQSVSKPPAAVPELTVSWPPKVIKRIVAIGAAALVAGGAAALVNHNLGGRTVAGSYTATAVCPRNDNLGLLFG